MEGDGRMDAIIGKIKSGKKSAIKKEFEPELGQAFFGNQFSEYSCQDFVEAGLYLLEQELERVMWNIHQKKFESAIIGGEDYSCPVFEIHAYYWGDDEEEKKKPNFVCENFEIRWYKHFGRGMSMNLPLDANKFFFMINKCLKYLRDLDKAKFDEVLKK